MNFDELQIMHWQRLCEELLGRLAESLAESDRVLDCWAKSDLRKHNEAIEKDDEIKRLKTELAAARREVKDKHDRLLKLRDEYTDLRKVLKEQEAK